MAKTKQNEEQAQQAEEQQAEQKPAEKSPAKVEGQGPEPVLTGNYRMGAEGLVDIATGKTIPLNQLSEKLDNAQKGMEVTSEYYEFPEGEEVKILYLGKTYIQGMQKDENGEYEVVPAVRFYVAGEQRIYINASNVLVSTLSEQNPLTGWSVYMKGKTRGKSGFEYYDYKISELLSG